MVDESVGVESYDEGDELAMGAAKRNLAPVVAILEYLLARSLTAAISIDTLEIFHVINLSIMG